MRAGEDAFEDELNAALDGLLLEDQAQAEVRLANAPSDVPSDVSELVVVASRLGVLKDAPEPTAVAMASGRRRMLEAAANKRHAALGGVAGRLRQYVVGGLGWRIAQRVPVAAVLGLVLVAVAAGGGAVIAANDSLPDSPLFAVKLASERVELLLTPDAQQREQLVERFEERRREETREMERRQVASGPGASTATASPTRLQGTPTATPEPRREGAPTWAPVADESETPGKAAEPRGTPTAKPSKTPNVDDDGDETDTPEPSRTPTAGRDPSPTPAGTPRATDSPRRGTSPTPQPTSEPSGTPRAGQTPTVLRTPEPSKTPEVEATRTATRTVPVPASLSRTPDDHTSF